jgi:hypothetical protein
MPTKGHNDPWTSRLDVKGWYSVLMYCKACFRALLLCIWVNKVNGRFAWAILSRGLLAWFPFGIWYQSRQEAHCSYVFVTIVIIRLVIIYILIDEFVAKRRPSKPNEFVNDTDMTVASSALNSIIIIPSTLTWSCTLDSLTLPVR